jgi:hypothetical protein
MRELLTRAMEQQSGARKGAPGSLKAYHRSLPDQVAAHLRAEADAMEPFPAATTANNGAGHAQGTGFKSKATIAEEQAAVLRRRAAEEEAAERAANGGAEL